jgi:hypothetical protein
MIASLSPACGKDLARCYRECQNACGYQGEDSQTPSNCSASKFTFEFSVLSVKHFATP